MPSIERFQIVIEARDWGQEIIIAHTPTYLGKCLMMDAGTKGGLQYHIEKDETFFLLIGRAVVRGEKDGKLFEVEMLPEQSYHVPPRAVHQVEAIEACIFFECSTPHFNDRVRVEAEFGLIQDGGLPTTR